MWGPEGWKKVVVCVVSDGRSKINKRTLQVLTLVSTAYIGVFCHLTKVQMGCYQDGVAKDTVGAKDVTAHIFEYVNIAVYHRSMSFIRLKVYLARCGHRKW